MEAIQYNTVKCPNNIEAPMGQMQFTERTTMT